MTKFFAILMALTALFISPHAHAVVTLVAEDFDGTTVGPGLDVSGGLTVTNVTDPADSTNKVGRIEISGGGQWQSLLQNTEYQLPSTTAANVDSINYSYRIYIPSAANNGVATIGATNNDSDSINTLIRVNATAPDAYPPSARTWTTEAFTFDEWVVVEQGGLIPEFNNLPDQGGLDPNDPTKSILPILSVQVKANATPDTLTSGIFGYIDDIQVSVTESITGGLTCNFNTDSQCDIADLDLLYANFGGDAAYDVDGSTVVDSNDIGAWLAAASAPANPYLGGTKTFALGDLTLDGNVDSTDLGQLLNNFGDTTGMLFGAGNLNGDATVDSSDLGLLLNTFGTTSAAAAAVPEPGTLSMLLIAAMGLVGLGRRRR